MKKAAWLITTLLLLCMKFDYSPSRTASIRIPTMMMPHRSYKPFERVYDMHPTPFPVKLRFALRLCGNFLLIGSNGDTQCGQRD